MKWAKKFVFFVLQLSALNSLIIFKNTLQKKIKRAKTGLSGFSYLTVFRI